MNLDELYQTVVLDHARRPRNFGDLPQASAVAEGVNPSCGDEVTVSVKLAADGDKIEDIKFKGAGCAISQASASMMTVKLKGKTRAEALAFEHVFHDMLTAATLPVYPQGFGDLQILEGVRKFPQRVKCATLGWNALKQALTVTSK
ncbi:MAG: SUF system NifU family Fe-S cluster assembly protein [Verrucomicrobiales bacterium]|jgi:nitrogen fixation NifU-like protein|nr:SUF system NifU family Fe-S cluster assembly protein [Verrucomicrobiales bacterium]